MYFTLDVFKKAFSAGFKNPGESFSASNKKLTKVLVKVLASEKNTKNTFTLKTSKRNIHEKTFKVFVFCFCSNFGPAVSEKGRWFVLLDCF